MQAGRIELLKLIGTNQKIFKVPVYQRTYDWDLSHCLKLVDDIFDSIESKKSHFTGSIVYLNETILTSENVALLIDGQQRITTTIIILKIISVMAKKLGFDNLYDELDRNYLFTKNRNLEKVFKLLPTEEDQSQFELLMYNKIEQMNHTHGIYKNYQAMYEAIESRIGDDSELLLNFYNAMINNLVIIEIILDKGIDDPQEIFESINSTGLELSKSDLIRNFLLMSASEQDHLYRSYWKPLSGKFTSNELEDFIFNYLMYKLGRKVNSKDIYRVFVDLFNVENYSREAMLSELLDASGIYEVFIRVNEDYSSFINEQMDHLRKIEQTTPYPFLFRLFYDFKNSLISELELVSVLKFIVTYHIKRLVVGSKSSTLRGFYVNLYHRIFLVKENKNHYYDAIANYFNELKTSDIVPSDSQFKRNLKIIDIYQQRKLTKFLLASIENMQSKEKLEIDTLTIEHIMPQTLDTNWSKMIGNDIEIHEKYLHTLGNLTLTGYNSDLGNKSFEVKKKMYQEFSKVQKLNMDVTSEASWSKQEIEQRSERLSDIILSLFEVPKYNQRSIRFEPVQEHDYTSEYDDIKGHELYSYKFINLDIERKKDTFRWMLIDIIKELDSIDSRIMDDIAKDFFNPWPEGRKDLLTNCKPEDSKSYKFRDNLYLIGYLSAPGCIYSIRKLMDIYGISKELFLFYTKVDMNKTDNLNDEYDDSISQEAELRDIN